MEPLEHLDPAEILQQKQKRRRLEWKSHFEQKKQEQLASWEGAIERAEAFEAETEEKALAGDWLAILDLGQPERTKDHINFQKFLFDVGVEMKHKELLALDKEEWDALDAERAQDTKIARLLSKERSQGEEAMGSPLRQLASPDSCQTEDHYWDATSAGDLAKLGVV